MEKKLRDLQTGDRVTGGLYHTSRGPAVGIVRSVWPARAEGYYVVMFDDRRTTSGNGEMVVLVQEEVKS